MKYEDAQTIRRGDSVREGGQVRTVIEIVSGLIAGPHFRLSGYPDTPREALTSHDLCQRLSD